MALAIGTCLGVYEIAGHIGSGGMGEVYRARDTKLDRVVAIKTLPAAFDVDSDRLARFDREAKLLATLNHVHIAAIYGLDEHEGTQFLAMELVEGQPLEEKLKDGALRVEDALHLARQIVAALEAAHEKGVVHRDLKPANVMITGDRQVKVLDFGLAKAFSGDSSQAVAAHSPALSVAMTQQGLILGTAGYMSPEQASGQATDQRADVWGFGVLLYEMLTGMPLFSGESVPHILADVLRTEPDWGRLPKQLHPRLRLLLEHCLEKKIHDRYHSIADVRIEIEAVLLDPERGAAGASEARPLWRRALPSAAALVLGVVLASASLIGSRPPATPTESAASLPVSRFEFTPPAEAPLTNVGGLDLAISPHGRRIAYFAEKPDTSGVDLYVRELDALEARPIAIEGRPVGNMNLFFSADGRSIGYYSPERDGIVSAAIDGRPMVKILDSPPGAFLEALWGADNTLIYSSGGLQRVSAGGGGTPEPLMPEREDVCAAAPVLLPGGRAVLFHAVEAGTDRVGVLDLESGEEKTFVEGAASPAYAETGHIVFARGTTLMAVPFDVAELAITAGLRRGRAERWPGPRSRLRAFVQRNAGLCTGVDEDAQSGSTVVWVDRSGQVVGRAVGDLVNNPRDPRLSPDGTRLLLVTGPFGDADFWSYDLGGRPPLPLAPPGDNRFPVWSPDSAAVAFASVEGRPEVLTLPADGSVLTPQPIRGGDVIGAPQAWSAAGELLLTIAPRNLDIVATSATANSEVRPIVASDYVEFDPALSPDGRWLTYVSDRTGQNEIWVQGYPDGVPVRVSSNGGYEPQWSADGRELFYRQGNAMIAVAVESDDAFSFTAPATLFSGPYLRVDGAGGRGYDIGRNGRFLMILPPSAEDGTAPLASIVVVQNFTEELRQRAPSSGPR